MLSDTEKNLQTHNFGIASYYADEISTGVQIWDSRFEDLFTFTSAQMLQTALLEYKIYKQIQI